jgi:hypothetical protein
VTRSNRSSFPVAGMMARKISASLLDLAEENFSSFCKVKQPNLNKNIIHLNNNIMCDTLLLSGFVVSDVLYFHYFF